MRGINGPDLDRYITGNYGEDQFAHCVGLEDKCMRCMERADEDRTIASIPDATTEVNDEWLCDDCAKEEQGEFPEEMITKPDGQPLKVMYELRRGKCKTLCPHGLKKHPDAHTVIGAGSIACQVCAHNRGTDTEEQIVKCNKGIGES